MIKYPSRPRLNRWSLLPGMLALTLLMAFATDVIIEDVLTGGHDALVLATAALAAITMAGAVLSTHAARSAISTSEERR